ncbi:membrane protein [gut metagenome]|uniref:Membrane protein n=1 Tax=gut metagenome TaxID=749906 RepID=J9CNM4_9ZZZZ
MLTYSIHLNADFLPFSVIFRCYCSCSLCSGTWNSVFTCKAVAHITSLTIRSHLAPGFFYYFLKIHVPTLLLYFFYFFTSSMAF